jgi:hypothetical protein
MREISSGPTVDNLLMMYLSMVSLSVYRNILWAYITILPQRPFVPPREKKRPGGLGGPPGRRLFQQARPTEP